MKVLHFLECKCAFSYLCRKSRSARVNTMHAFLPELLGDMLYIVGSAYKDFKMTFKILAHVTLMFGLMFSCFRMVGVLLLIALLLSYSYCRHPLND
jgi:hypothetical protein